jgi:hypothetical protein
MIRTHRLQLMNSSKYLSGKPRNETGVSQYMALDYTTLFCASGVVLPSTLRSFEVGGQQLYGMTRYRLRAVLCALLSANPDYLHVLAIRNYSKPGGGQRCTEMFELAWRKANN